MNMSAKTAATTNHKEARRIKRIELKLPARIDGKDLPDTNWHEITRLKDVSVFGASFALGRPIKRGRLVQVTLPMPRQLRNYDHSETQYRVWSIVRSCVAGNRNAAEPTFLLGVAFIGKHPPKIYLDDPSQSFHLSLNQENGVWHLTAAPENPSPIDFPQQQDRRHSRYAIPMNITVELIDRDKKVFRSETTATENISLGGATVFSSLDLEIGSCVQIRTEQNQATIGAKVRGKRMGSDGIPRLHVEFIDRLFPLNGIETT